jgi:hypothetical protein
VVRFFLCVTYKIWFWTIKFFWCPNVFKNFGSHCAVSLSLSVCLSKHTHTLTHSHLPLLTHLSMILTGIVAVYCKDSAGHTKVLCQVSGRCGRWRHPACLVRVFRLSSVGEEIESNCLAYWQQISYIFLSSVLYDILN